MLKDKKFKKVYRKGKYLIAELDNDPHILVLHFGMTGNLAYGLKENISEEDKKYTKLIFEFSNHYQLLYKNIRKLGKIYLATDIADIKPLKNIGPDPFDLDQKEFLQILEKHKKKNLLSITKKILIKAVAIFNTDKDSTNYPDFWLLAHQKDRQCPTNKEHSMKKETIAGRSTLYCPQHQCK